MSDKNTNGSICAGHGAGRRFAQAWIEQLIVCSWQRHPVLADSIRNHSIREVKANIWAVAWPYVCLFSVFLIYHFLRAPKLLDQDRQAAIDSLETRVGELTAELRAKDEEACIGIEVRDCRINARLFGHFGAAIRRGEVTTRRWHSIFS